MSYSNCAWSHKHALACCSPAPCEKPIVGFRDALHDYAEQYAEAYETPIGDDGVLGPAFLRMAKAFVCLLDGETGRLDCGTLWGETDSMLKRHGFEKGLDT